MSLDSRPIVMAIAGPNGAGKSTFYQAHLRPTGLRFVNADDLARELNLEAYEAAELADRVRRELLRARESFIFETVFSDPVGEKVAFLRDAVQSGYSVVLCFIGLESSALSDERVAIRVLQGGHDVPSDKIAGRFPRSLENLRRAIQELPIVCVFDNSDLGNPYRKVAELKHGQPAFLADPVPDWFRAVLPG